MQEYEIYAMYHASIHLQDLAPYRAALYTVYTRILYVILYTFIIYLYYLHYLY